MKVETYLGMPLILSCFFLLISSWTSLQLNLLFAPDELSNLFKFGFGILPVSWAIRTLWVVFWLDSEDAVVLKHRVSEVWLSRASLDSLSLLFDGPFEALTTTELSSQY